MKSRIISSITILFLISACSLFQKDTFQGTWILTVKGDYNDTIEFNVNEGNTFSFVKSIATQGQNYDASFNGKILADGTFVCDVEIMSMKVAQFNGKVTYENGSGSWSGTGMGGNWTAVKK
jgi:hypothetical protein